MDIEKQVIKIISQQLNPKEEIHSGSHLINDLKVDSLDIVEIVMSIEESFEIQIPDDDAESLTTVKDIVEYIRNKKT